MLTRRSAPPAQAGIHTLALAVQNESSIGASGAGVMSFPLQREPYPDQLRNQQGSGGPKLLEHEVHISQLCGDEACQSCVRTYYQNYRHVNSLPPYAALTQPY